jgi:hypothetical protein
MFLPHQRSHKTIAGKSYCAYYCFCKSEESIVNERGDVNTITPQVTPLDLEANPEMGVDIRRRIGNSLRIE